MSLAIVIPTYQRFDGKTPFYLNRCLNSIKNQIFQEYVVYLIGDFYEDNDEFTYISTSIINKDKIKFVNLPYADERNKYKIGSKELWACGGVNATNIGIEMALNDGFEYICRLDHDDYWSNEHLDLITENIYKNYIIIATLSLSHKNQIIPKNKTIPFYPISSDIIHSSTCVNFKKIPFRYRDVYLEEKIIYPADADLWNRLNKYMKENNENGILIDKITCFHDSEGFIKNSINNE